MDSKALKRIEVAKRKARAGEKNENMFVDYLPNDCIFFKLVCVWFRYCLSQFGFGI